MDVLEAADARAIEPDSALEQSAGQLADRDRKVLPGTNQVHEFEVDDLDALLVRQVDDGVRVRLYLFSRPDTLVNCHMVWSLRDLNSDSTRW